MDKETLRQLAIMLREQYVDASELVKALQMNDFFRGKIAGNVEVIEAIERLVEQDVL